MYFIDSVLSGASGTSLAMDAFAVALCIGAGRNETDMTGAALRMGAACGAFQLLMPLAGWLLGAYAANLISSLASFDHWIAFALLAFVGGNMIRESFDSPDTAQPDRENLPDPTKSTALLYLATATSIDAFAVGASFALDSRPVFALAVSAGAITALLSYLGVQFGKRIGCRMGKRVELIGGLVLILIGANILREHMLT